MSIRTATKQLKIPVLLADLTTGIHSAYDNEVDAVLDARQLEEQGHSVKIYERRRNTTNPRGIARRVIYPTQSTWGIE